MSACDTADTVVKSDNDINEIKGGNNTDIDKSDNRKKINDDEGDNKNNDGCENDNEYMIMAINMIKLTAMVIIRPILKNFILIELMMIMMQEYYLLIHHVLNI